MANIEALKARFIELYKNNVKREGADRLLDYLISRHIGLPVMS